MAISVPTTDIQEVRYADFLRKFNYRQQDHITVCGPTGCGKSVLLIDAIIPRRDYSIYLSTKPRDSTLEDSVMAGEDYGWTDDPGDIHPSVRKKWVVGLKGFADPETVKAQHRDLFGKTLNKCFSQTGWAMIVDEGRYVCDPKYLGLMSTVAQYYIQGRSDYKSVVIATQRPVWVPPEAFDQATHLFFFNDEDLKNVERMAEAAGANRKAFLDVIPQLEITENEGGQFLYYNRLTKAKYISKVEL